MRALGGGGGGGRGDSQVKSWFPKVQVLPKGPSWGKVSPLRAARLIGYVSTDLQSAPPLCPKRSSILPSGQSTS